MDRRLTPATARVAHESLRGVLDAPAWTNGEPARITAPLTDLNREDGRRDRQLNFGADVTVIDRHAGRAFVQAAADGYCGWVDEGALGTELPAITHRVRAPATHLYPAPDMKTREIASLSLNARLSVLAIEGRFARIPQGFVPVQHISNSPARDPASVAETLLGTPYLWGGNSRGGIDCSGLVQAARLACDLPCPGDSDLQQAMGALVGGAFQRGDLLFWPGHVAMALDAQRMIHATAFAMSVIVENIQDAIARIEASGDGPFLGAKRA